MSDLEELLAAFDAGTLVRPSPAVPNLVDLSRTIMTLLEVDGVETTPGSQEITGLIGPCDHLIFVLADGLGLEFIRQLDANAFLSRHLIKELQTVFPSATAVALTSVATGQWPSRHAVTGWWTHLPEIGLTSTILPFTTRSDARPLSRLGVTPEQAYPLPSLFGSIECDALALLPERISQSVYSVYFSGGKAIHGYQSLQEAVDDAAERTRNNNGPTFTYLYTNKVDTAAHAYGTRHSETRTALLELDREIERLATLVSSHTRIVLSADHGFLDSGEQARHQIRSSEPLLGLLRCPPSGDTRALYMHLRQGTEKKVREYFRKRFDHRFFVIAVDEADALGLFGPEPLSAVARGRMGDMMAISAGADAIEYRPSRGSGRVMQEASQHSGLTPSEMHIPLILA